MAIASDVLTPTWESINDTDFYLKPLSGIEFMEVAEDVKFDLNGNALISAKTCQVILNYGLQGWRNYRDPNGEEIAFSGSQHANISRIQMEDIKPVTLAILAKSTLGVDDQKKS